MADPLLLKEKNRGYPRFFAMLSALMRVKGFGYGGTAPTLLGQLTRLTQHFDVVRAVI